MGPVFSYTNYRKLMKDFYEGKKQENTGFSYQVFSRMAGFKTPREVEFAEIPRTATGKIQKNVLKKRELELAKAR